MPLLDQNVYFGYIRDAINDDDPALNTHSDDFNGALNHGGGYGNVYYKTATMLYNLQYVLGEELFQKALQHYFNQWKMAHPYFEDFRASIIQYTKTDLNWFFDQWLETTKKIDYSVGKVNRVDGVNKVEKAEVKSNFEIQFRRKGLMQMPIDFTVYTKDSNYQFVIPNTYFVKQTSATVLPTWKGWGLLNQTYTAKISLPAGSKITNIQIDPTYKLADINQLDNSSKRPILFTFDHQLNNPMDRKHYILKWRPDVWYNNYDGVKIGLHFNGNYMNQKHVFSFTTWYNSAMATNYKTINYIESSKIYPIHYNLSYRHRMAKLLDLDLQSRVLDGLVLNKIGLNKTVRNTTYKINVKSMRRVQLYYLPAFEKINVNGLYFHPELSSYDKWNNTLNLEMEHNYSKGIGTGKIIVGMRTSAIYSDFDYASIYMNIVQNKTLHKFDLRTRLFAQYMTGNNAAPESQLYLAGANPEEMAENKFTRSAGILPADWFSIGQNTNHFQMGGGLNIRGFAGYLMPVTQGLNQYFMYKGNSGASVSLELDYDKYFNIPPRGLLKNFHLDSYIFGDAGILQANNPKISETTLPIDNQTISTNVLASAGAGFALTIKRWSYFDGIKPLTIRFDMPLYLSNAPFVDENNIKFRWQLGINRTF
jgi:aminopeptidase N